MVHFSLVSGSQGPRSFLFGAQLFPRVSSESSAFSQPMGQREGERDRERKAGRDQERMEGGGSKREGEGKRGRGRERGGRQRCALF